MEYIQCPHCQKKYGVNDKVRAASGKSIRCKSCQESFEITIFSTPAAPAKSDPSESEPLKSSPPENNPPEEKTSDSEVSEKPSSEEEAESGSAEGIEEKKAPTKIEPEKKNYIQIVLTVVLGLVLLAGLIFAYQLSQTPQRPKVEPRKVVQPFTKPVLQEPVVTPVTPQPEVNQKEIDAQSDATDEASTPLKENEAELAKELNEATNPTAADPAATDPVATDPVATDPVATDPVATDPVATETQPVEEKSPKSTANDPLHIGPDNPTDECKLAATDQWFVDYMITHGALSGTEYIRMLDESSSKTEEVRNACNSKYLASKIADAARQDIKPEWIRMEINARASSIYGKESKSDGKW